MRLALLLFGLCALVDMPWDMPARAAAFPEHPIRLVVPFTPGGSVDVTARLVGERLAVGLGQPVVIDNRPGAGGAIGAELVAKAAPDGYSLLVGSSSTHGTNSAVYKNLPYDAIKDFAPIVLVTRFPFLLVARPGLPVQRTDELIAWARGRSDKLNYGSYGQGSSTHLPMELLCAMTGLDMVHVPYKGAAPAIAALTQGEIDLMFDSPTTSAAPIRSGLVTLLGVGGAVRSPLFPDTPTIAESGLPGFVSDSFIGFFAPAGTPASVIERLHRETVAALAQPELRERLEVLGYEVVGGSGAALGETVRVAVDKWQRLVRERHLSFE
jgi:tripartite-type tricarboxylate transporter receptor subunit TctC